MRRVVIIGAGIGGLTSAISLARSGFKVTILEAHIYPGGCAGTFYHQGYRFDAGATLAGGFYEGGPMDQVAKIADIKDWSAQRTNPVMGVMMPTSEQIYLWGDERRHETRKTHFGAQGEDFWKWQEQTADALWDLALRSPEWPPQDLYQFQELIKHGVAWWQQDALKRSKPGLIADFFRSVNHHLQKQDDKLCLFVDAQLLISAQTTSKHANALYGASALDLPRRSVVHLSGGMGTIANLLVESLKKQGGEIMFRQQVTKVFSGKDNTFLIETARKDRFDADIVVFNLPPWNIARILGDEAPGRIKKLPIYPKSGWGAFMLYVGVDESVIPSHLPLHNQVIMKEPLGEGNTVFISISPAWDPSRAPRGKRAITISTHTQFLPWWYLYENDRQAYDRAKQDYTNRILMAASRLFPQFKEASQLILPGTPVTFERFTRRAWGWVGGFPQTSLFQSWGPRIKNNLWMVGDSVFPGQSVAAVALGGLRVANDIQKSELLSN